MFTFLRSLFVVHDWAQTDNVNARFCRTCGRREEQQVDDWSTSWWVVWKGYPRAHFTTRPVEVGALPALRAHGSALPAAANEIHTTAAGAAARISAGTDLM